MTGATTSGPARDSTGEVDVEALVARVREEVAEKRRSGFYPEAMEAELDSTFQGLGRGDAVRLALRNLEVLASGELPAPMGSARPGIGPLVVRAKRLVRRLLHPFVDVPIQHELHATSVLARSMLAHVDHLQAEVDELRNVADRLARRVAELEGGSADANPNP